MRNVIYYISKHYYKINKVHPKTIDGWHKRGLTNRKFLNNIFANDREEFVNTYSTNLQKGRVKQHLNTCYDSTGMSYFHAIENYFLYGWWYDYSILNNGDKYESMHCNAGTTKGLTTNTSLQYAKFLTEKYGKELFVRPENKLVA
jgi:hypothetical protein